VLSRAHGTETVVCADTDAAAASTKAVRRTAAREVVWAAQGAAWWIMIEGR